MFTLEKVYEPKGLQHMVVSNDVVIMGLANGHLMRLRLDAPLDIEGKFFHITPFCVHVFSTVYSLNSFSTDIEFARKGQDQIHKLFLDPTGNSLIISMENKDNWYLHSSWKKPRILSKMKVESTPPFLPCSLLWQRCTNIFCCHRE